MEENKEEDAGFENEEEIPDRGRSINDEARRKEGEMTEYDKAIYVLKQFKQLKKILCDNAIPAINIDPPQHLEKETYRAESKINHKRSTKHNFEQPFTMKRISEISANISHLQPPIDQPSPPPSKIINLQNLLKTLCQLYQQPCFRSLLTNNHPSLSHSIGPSTKFPIPKPSFSVPAQLSQLKILKNFTILKQ